MWFLLGIVTTLGFAAYVVHRRLIEPWSGERSARAETKVIKHKGRITKLRVGVGAPAKHDFTLRRQRALDAFFVRLGLSHEQTVGDVVFDDSMYLLSDDARLGLWLRRDPQLRDALFGLVHETASERVRVQRVRCVAGRLWVDAKPLATLQPEQVPAVVDQLAPGLERAAERLAARPPLGAQSGDHSLLKAVVLLGASAGLAINGAVQLVRLGLVSWPIMLDRRGLLLLAVGLGLGLAALLLVLTVVLLRGSSRAHGVALELLLTGTLGGVATSYAQLYDYNVEADTGAAEQVVAPLVERESYRCGKRGRSTCYRVTVASDQLPDPTFKVDASTYRRLASSNHVVLLVHPGKLGFRWLEGIHPAEPADH